MKFKSEEEALEKIKEHGGRVEDNIIWPPDDINAIHDQTWEEFWDAMKYLQMEHDYENGNSIPFCEFDLDEFLNDE